MTATSIDDPPSNGLPPNEESMPNHVSPSSLVGPAQPESEPGLPTVRPRSGHRMLSESDADNAGLIKQRKQRRRRGRGRWKPYHDMTIAEKLAKDERVERNALRKRARLFSHGKPMAPYNTTQFLLEDREKRVTADSDGDSVSGTGGVPNGSRGCISPQRDRTRLLSGSDPGGNTSESGSVSGEEDELLEREFDAEYDSVNLLRISGMSREEVSRLSLSAFAIFTFLAHMRETFLGVLDRLRCRLITREMMYLERNNGKLVERVSNLQVENESLKKLLEQNNIDYENALNAKRRRSGDSFESDASAVLPSECTLEPQQSDLNTTILV
ncbi:unnamed protein product [Toxocara canis]|uniref:Hexamethylene bis-acetamide inducible 1 n=1 Tax=Toxocara canis TaxID=6265 RepID=A0A183V0X1_TOXCA|nr:unnamed protein product [Toxocara canis]